MKHETNTFYEVTWTVGSLVLKLGQLKSLNKRNIFIKKFYENRNLQNDSRPF